MSSTKVWWKDEGYDIKTSLDDKGRIKARLGGVENSFKEGIEFSRICSGSLGFRYSTPQSIYESSTNSIFQVSQEFGLYTLLAFCNTPIASQVLNLINPTINIMPEDVRKLPFGIVSIENIDIITKENVSISKTDWDAHETSWDFQTNELMKIDLKEAMRIIEEPYIEQGITVSCPRFEVEKLSVRLDLYKKKWSRLFTQLHRNEEELNRRFIEIYGLQDELTPDVPFNEVTILQHGEINHDATVPVYSTDGADGYTLSWNDDAIIKQFISYGMGCIMGRYSIDKPGLVIASQGDTDDDYYQKVYGCAKEDVPADKFRIDDDGIVPLMSINNELTDNAALSFKRWLESALGTENLVENLNTIQQILGKNIETYFQKDFWKEHKKRYQNRPIYWLFSSKKGAFQCLVYMHRMDAYTPERIRTRYLLPHIDWLRRKKAELDERSAMLTGRERKELDAINKQIDECLEYHDRLHTVADAQQPIDLDDGVLTNYSKFGSVVSKL